MNVPRNHRPLAAAAALAAALSGGPLATAQDSPLAAAQTALEACGAAAARQDEGAARAQAATARTALGKRLSAAPEDGEARVLRARVLIECEIPFATFLAKGQLAGAAEEDLAEALRLDPTHQGARHLLATLLYHLPPFLNRTEDAIRHLDLLIARQEETGGGGFEAYLMLGDLHRRKGDEGRAREVWRRGLARHPDAVSLRERLDGPGAQGGDAPGPAAPGPPPAAVVPVAGAGPIEKRLRARLAAAAARPGMAGLSVAVLRGEETLLLDGFGLADLENRVPATADTVYRLGSVTKQLVAATAARLAGAGRLALDDPLARWLPDLPGSEGITLRHLLTHTAGLPRDLPDEQEEEDWRAAALAPSHRVGRPGERYFYSNAGYALLGEALAAAAGRDAVETQLLRPLGLDGIRWCDERALVPHRAEGYQLSGADLVNDEPLADAGRLRWAGGLCGSARALARWLRALHHGEVLGEVLYRQMVTPPPVLDPAGTSYAFGLRAGADPAGHPVVQHSGGINGFLSETAWYPGDDLAVVVLANSDAAAPRELGHELAALARGDR